MAGGLLPGGGGSGLGNGKLRRTAGTPMAEINVTPMVDVMLVLLIIFMVAAPLLTVGVEVELPETEAEALTEQVEPITISVTANGEIFVQETEVPYDELVTRLEAIAGTGYDGTIYLRADKRVLYDDVAKVMGRLKAAGYSKIGLVNDNL
ncbi:protein TolR [Parvularcula lutaonensis]|uniref:Protein TolR n=1 Tax=Parvularcula lutaonensis TaxID=491923 RepID=A0ABV7MEF8_9PROT|nr:protein TolR [Parvularcula lutaonensis]GGY53602.1 protein TolR [Parvularcula lutaonensis]